MTYFEETYPKTHLWEGRELLLVLFAGGTDRGERGRNHGRNSEPVLSSTTSLFLTPHSLLPYSIEGTTVTSQEPAQASYYFSYPTVRDAGQA